MKSYSEISRKTGVSVSHISRVMRGIRMPSLNVASKIALALGINISTLLYRIEDARKGNKFK